MAAEVKLKHLIHRTEEKEAARAGEIKKAAAVC